MADSHISVSVTYATPYTVPSGKALYFVMYGGSGPAQLGNTMGAGAVIKRCTRDAVAVNDGLAANMIKGVLPAGGVIAVNNNPGNPAAAYFSGVLRDA